MSLSHYCVPLAPTQKFSPDPHTPPCWPWRLPDTCSPHSTVLGLATSVYNQRMQHEPGQHKYMYHGAHGSPGHHTSARPPGVHRCEPEVWYGADTKLVQLMQCSSIDPLHHRTPGQHRSLSSCVPSTPRCLECFWSTSARLGVSLRNNKLISPVQDKCC